MTLRESIQNRIKEIDIFYDLNFDKPYITNFETGRLKLKKLLMYEPEEVRESTEEKENKYTLFGYEKLSEVRESDDINNLTFNSKSNMYEGDRINLNGPKKNNIIKKRFKTGNIDKQIIINHKKTDNFEKKKFDKNFLNNFVNNNNNKRQNKVNFRSNNQNKLSKKTVNFTNSIDNFKNQKYTQKNNRTTINNSCSIDNIIKNGKKDNEQLEKGNSKQLKERKLFFVLTKEEYFILMREKAKYNNTFTNY